MHGSSEMTGMSRTGWPVSTRPQKVATAPVTVKKSNDTRNNIDRAINL